MAFNPPYYTSPENQRGDSSSAEKTDAWSIGTMLYTMVGGRPPFYESTV